MEGLHGEEETEPGLPGAAWQRLSCCGRDALLQREQRAGARHNELQLRALPAFLLTQMVMDAVWLASLDQVVVGAASRDAHPLRPRPLLTSPHYCVTVFLCRLSRLFFQVRNQARVSELVP